MRKIPYLLLAAGALTFAVGCGSASDGTSPDGTVSQATEQALRHGLSGAWTTGACNITSFTPKADGTADFVCNGASVWTGSLTGTTTYVITGNLNLTTGDSKGLIDETYTGSGPHHRQGTIRFFETFSVVAGALKIAACARSGTGGFEDVRGFIDFVGTSNADGSGAGTYSGRLHFEGGQED